MPKKLSIFLLALLLFDNTAHAGSIVKNIKAEGSCAIVGMSAEQCQLTALQRARAAVIEEAAGVKVSSSTLVINMSLAADFIKTYSRGLIVNERVEWLPLSQYQKDASTSPIPEYRVKIIADVNMPEPKIKPIGLKANINNVVYKSGANAAVEARVGRDSRIAIFNVTADDKVVMLLPNGHEKSSVISRGNKFIFPDKNSKIELLMETLPGHKRDAEAFFVVAMDSGYEKDFSDIFHPLEPMSFSDFFKKYADIVDYCEDVILTYEVVTQ